MQHKSERTFNFTADVNQEKFRLFHSYAYNEEIEDASMPSTFESSLISSILWGIEHQTPIEYYRIEAYFHSGKAGFALFLQQPQVLEQLSKKIGSISLLPVALTQKLEDAFKKSKGNYTHEEMIEDKTLESIFPIFEFIKDLTDDEVSLITERYPKVLDMLSQMYISNVPFLTFRADLRELDRQSRELDRQSTPDAKRRKFELLLSFEEKYAGCMAGMFGHFICPMLLNEMILGEVQKYRTHKPEVYQPIADILNDLNTFIDSQLQWYLPRGDDPRKSILHTFKTHVEEIQLDLYQVDAVTTMNTLRKTITQDIFNGQLISMCSKLEHPTIASFIAFIRFLLTPIHKFCEYCLGKKKPQFFAETFEANMVMAANIFSKELDRHFATLDTLEKQDNRSHLGTADRP